jgi:hypothetical protein
MTPPTVSLALGFLVETIGVTPWMIGPPDENPQCQPLPHAQALAVLFCSVLLRAVCARLPNLWSRASLQRESIEEGRKLASCKRLFSMLESIYHIRFQKLSTFAWNFVISFSIDSSCLQVLQLCFSELFLCVFGRNSFFPFWQIDPRCFESQ